jgi:ankyrin repeat protein
VDSDLYLHHLWVHYIPRVPLSIAVAHGNGDIVHLPLHREDIRVNQGVIDSDYHGLTPLFPATTLGHERVVRLLLKTQNIKVNVDCNGNTPLQIAVGGQRENVVRLLLKRNDIDIDHMNNEGLTALSFASKNSNETILKLLEDRKQELQAQSLHISHSEQ